MARQPKDPNAPKRVQGPRPAYLVLKGAGAKEFAEAVSNGSIRIVSATRKADEVLAPVSDGTADAYVRFEIK